MYINIIKSAGDENFMAELDVKTLNAMIEKDCRALVRRSEKNYRDLISDIAERIIGNQKIRIVLLAGPSGSGKTTSANLLSDALKSRGKSSMVVSLDDFYRSADDPEYPRLENGERDFEAAEALHIPDLVKTLNAIARGEKFMLPKFDFKLGARSEEKIHPEMNGGIVIIEGLHALNPKVFSLLPPESLLKIFISVSTNITLDGKVIISGRKIRFVRRMVRDSIFRASDAERTLSMWMNVLAGEDKYLYPHRHNADISFDTFHPYELGVMHPFADELISDKLAEANSYAGIVKSALDLIPTVPVALVPENSLIREFVAGGKYEEIY